MRNLVVHRQRCRPISFLNDSSEPKCAVNINNNDLYVCVDKKIYTVPLDRNRDISNISCNSLKIIGIEYCVITQKIFYCTYYQNSNTSDIIRVKSLAEKYLQEEEATFDCGIQCMKLSPDHEIITVVTSEGNVIVMLSNFQIITEANLYSSDFGEKQFITVGWGKKDTQFHGSEGKAAAKAKPEEVLVNKYDDGLPRITWCADGSLFAVSFQHAQTKIRQFKIFNREGILQYTNEPTTALEECLAWKPSGSLIAACQKRNNEYIIALFEKNGLKHREFLLSSLPCDAKVTDLFWSPDSDILAIIIKIKQNNLNYTELQLWTESNYYWYLKQVIKFDTDPLMYATWNTTTEDAKKELILLTKHKIIFCAYNWCVNHSMGKSMDDKAVVGVINGKTTLMTDFRTGIIPPPMSHHKLLTEKIINEIIFAPNINAEKSWINSNLFCLVSQYELIFYKQKTDNNRVMYEKLKSCYIGNLCDCSYSKHHFLWFAEDIILCSITTLNDDFLYVLSLKGKIYSVLYSYAMNGPIEHIISSPDADIAYVIVDKSVLRYKKDEGLEKTDIKLKKFCQQVEIIKIDTKHVIIALSHMSLLIDGEEVANNITSFSVHSEFLLLTTLQHTLISVRLNEMEQLIKYDLTIKPWKNGTNEMSFAGIGIRRIERGSRLIITVPQDSRTILQMPRGNLECIQPRALSLHMIGMYLDNCNYLAAFKAMRKQRINLNLIYDHNPKLFVDNAKKFVQDIANPNWLSLFLSELQNEDITTTMYAYSYPERLKQSDVALTNKKDIETKVDMICTMLRDIMEKHDTNLMQPILISMIKNQQSSGLQLALGKIKQIKAAEDLQNSSYSSSEKALKYLLYLVDINVLYNTALSMYDLELTMFVASKSQKDPKEYIPFLNELQKMDENYMKYSIDIHLKYYESALEHLSKILDKFNECLQLIGDKKLYKKAMKLFEKDSTEYKKIAHLFGEYLLLEEMYQEAAIMFYKSEHFHKALNAHVLAGNWQDAIIVSAKANLSPADLRMLYEELVKRLKADRKYKDMAKILKYYLNDDEEAVASYCEARCWKHALMIAQGAQRLDLNETHIIPGIKEYANHVTLQLQKIEEDFINYKSRLAAVRTKMREARIFKNTEMVIANHDNRPAEELWAVKEVTDFLSDASSVVGSVSSQKTQASTASGRSYRSNKNRRKQERKLFSMKEGSIFEDLGLIHALYQIISNVYKDKEEWSLLIYMLIHFQFDKRAEQLQERINQIFKLIESSKYEIWDRSAPISLTEKEKMATYTPAQLQEITANLKLMEPYIMYPPPVPDTSHALDVF